MAKTYRRNELAQELFKKNPHLVDTMSEDEIVDSAIKKNPELSSRIVYTKAELASNLFKKNPQYVEKFDENQIVDMAIKANPNLKNRIVDERKFALKQKFTKFGEKLKGIVAPKEQAPLPDITQGPVISAARPLDIKERVKRLFQAPAEKKIARAQVAHQISKETGLPIQEVEKDIGRLAKEKAKDLGFATQPETEQLVGVALAPAIASGLAMATVPTVVGLGAFALLDTVAPVEKFIPSDASDTTKSVIEVADFIAKGMIVGGLTVGRKFISNKIKGTKSYKNLVKGLKSKKIRKLSTAELIDRYKTAGREIKRELAETEPRIRKWLAQESLRAGGKGEIEVAAATEDKLLEFKPNGKQPPAEQFKPPQRPEPPELIKPKQEAKPSPPDLVDAAKARMGIVEPKPAIAKPVKLTEPIEPKVLSAPVEFKAETPVEITKPPVVAPRGNISTIKTGRGTADNVQWAVLPASELLASNKTNLSIEPDFPKALQPRQRERAASELQISGIVNNLDPALLGESVLGGTGAPIVTPEGVVVSGNARTIALKRIYERGINSQATKYKNWLADNADRFGIPRAIVKNIENPVLVRVTEARDNNLVKLASELNESTVQVMSASERALEDARKIDASIIERLAVDEKGNLDTIANRQFINDFASKVIPTSEINTFIDPAGQLSQEGSRRLMASVFAKAYEEPQLIKRLIESNDNQIKAVVNGMRMSAPKLLKMRKDIADGNLYNLDIVENINEAARILADLRREGTSVEQYLKQPDMFANKPSKETLFLLEIFGNKKYLRSPEKIRALMVDYANEVEALGNPNQLTFNTAEVPSKMEMLKFALNKGQQTVLTNQALGETALDKAGLFAEQAFDKIKPTNIDKLPDVSTKLINEVRDTSTGTEGFVLNPLPNSSKMTQEGAGGGENSVKAYQDINKNLADHVKNDYKDVIKNAKSKSLKHKMTQAIFDNAFILWGKGKMPSSAYAKYRTKGSRQLAMYNNFQRGFFDILKGLKNKKELKLGQAIYLNKFYAQSNAIGKTTNGVTAVDARKASEILRNENSEIYDRVEGIMDSLAKYTNEKGLGLLRDFDIVPKELLSAWMDRMPNYVSARALNASLDHAFGIEGGDATSRLTGGFLKMRKGHDYEIETDLLKNIMNSVREKIVYSTNVDTMREIVKDPDLAVEIGKVVSTKGKLDLKVHPMLALEDLEFRQFEKGNRVKRVLYKNVKKPDDFINLTSAIDGKIYAVDPDVYRLLQIGDKNTLGVIGGLFKGFNRVFQMSATALRFAFGLVTNPQRDIFTALLNVRSKEGGGANKILSPGRYARGVWESARASLGIPGEFAKRAIDNGILRSSLVYTSKDVKKPFKFLSIGQQAARIAKAPVMIPWKVLTVAGETFENAPKMAEFKRLEDAGYPDTLSAITMARRVNADFDVHGGKTSTLRNLLVFFNPMLQGFNILLQTLGAQPKTSARRIFMYGVLPPILLHLWNRDKPGEELIDDWIKDNYYYLNTGIMYKNAYGNTVPIVVTWSKSEWQKIVNPIQWMMEEYDKDAKGKSEFDSMGSKVFDNLAQWGTGFVPPIIRSTVEVNIGDPGYSFYTRSPIVPPGREGLEKRLQFRPSDSIPFRVLAERMGVSSAKLSHFVRSNLPAIAQLEEVLNYVLRNKVKLPGLKKEKGPEKFARLIPLIKIPSGFKTVQDVERGFGEITKERESEAMEFLYLLKESVISDNPDDAKIFLERALKAAEKVSAKRRSKIVEQVQKGIISKQIPLEVRSFSRQSPAAQAEFVKRFPKTAQRVFESQKLRSMPVENDMLTAAKKRLKIPLDK